MLILPLSIVLLRMVASQSGIIRDNQALTNDPTVISMALYIYIYIYELGEYPSGEIQIERFTSWLASQTSQKQEMRFPRVNPTPALTNTPTDSSISYQ